MLGAPRPGPPLPAPGDTARGTVPVRAGDAVRSVRSQRGSAVRAGRPDLAPGRGPCGLRPSTWRCDQRSILSCCGV